MKVVIEIPLDQYDRFIDQCDEASPYYSILKNGIIIRRPKAHHFERAVEIHCPVEEAKLLLDRATRVYPQAVPYV
jgi:hypothetical protein